MGFEADPGQSAGSDQGFFAEAGGMFASGALSLKAVENTKVETQKLVDAAKSGGFTISEEGVKPMRAALLETATKLDEVMRQSFTFSQAPRLGSHAYGHAVAAHDQKGAANETGSATVVLQQLTEILKQAHEALARAAGVYHEGEQQVIDTIRKI